MQITDHVWPQVKFRKYPNPFLLSHFSFVIGFCAVNMVLCQIYILIPFILHQNEIENQKFI